MLNLDSYKVISRKQVSKLNYYILQDSNQHKYFVKEITGNDESFNLLIKNEIEKYQILKEYTFIPKIIEYDDNYIIYEYIDGTNLNKVDRLDLKKALEIFKKLCDKIQKIHNNNLVHCDLKGTNIILKDNNLYIIDLGNCHFLSEKTNYGSIVYCSTEQLKKEPITVYFDYYSLAVILYELITEKQPYQKKDIKALIEEKKKFPLITDYILNYPKDLDVIIDKLTNKKYNNLLETIEDIDKMLSKMEE